MYLSYLSKRTYIIKGKVFTVKSISSMCARDQTGMEASSEQVNGQNTDV